MKLIAMICCAALFGALAGCAGGGPGAASPSAALKPSVYGDSDFDTSGDIVVKTEYDVYGSDAPEVSYTITNNTDAELTYGVPYEIEVYLDGKWYQAPFPEDTGWISIGIILKPHSTNADSFKFSSLDYTFTDGSYRLIKELGGKRYFAEFQVGQSPITAETPFGYQPLEKLPKDYPAETAAANGDVVIAPGGIRNTEKLAEFVDKAALGMPAMLRLTQYTTEGDPVILDCVYNEKQSGYYLYRLDNSRDRFGGADTGVTQTIYSNLITDGTSLYLSNCASWELKETYPGADGALLSWPASLGELSDAVGKVREMTEKRLQWNTARCRVYSPDGARNASMHGGLSYGYQGIDRSEMRTVSDPDKIATEITDIVWLSDESFVLICDTSGAAKYYEVVGGAGTSGYGTEYRIVDGAIEIIK